MTVIHGTPYIYILLSMINDTILCLWRLCMVIILHLNLYNIIIERITLVGDVRMRGNRILAIVGHLLGLAVHGPFVHPQSSARSQVVRPPTFWMWHILVVLFGPSADTFRCRVICAHERPNVTSLPGGYIPLPGTVLIPFGVLGAELGLTLHLQLVFGYSRVPPVDAHFLGRPVRWFEMTPATSNTKKNSFFYIFYRNDLYYRKHAKYNILKQDFVNISNIEQLIVFYLCIYWSQENLNFEIVN